MKHGLDGHETQMEFTYDYDDSYQLTATTNSNLTGNDEDFSYDPAGNRTGNTLLANNRLIDDGTYSYIYDQEGDLTSKTDETTGDVWTYTYDNRHRLTQVHADGPTVGHEYTPIGYDEKGNVYNVNGPNFFDGTTPVSGYHSTGVSNGDFVLYFANPNTGQVLSYDPDNWSLNPLGTRWMLTDAQGSTRAVITGTTVSDRITYSSFGSITSETASPGLDQPTFTYEGMVDPRQGWNAASGLLLDHARLYDPNTSRFLTPDPSPSSNNDQFNLYRYAWNDPINLFDPTGTSATRNYFGSADYNLSLSGYSTRGSSVSTPSFNFNSTSSLNTSLTPYYSYSTPVSTPIPTSYAGIGAGAVIPGTISTLGQPAASFSIPSLSVLNQPSDYSRLSAMVPATTRITTTSALPAYMTGPQMYAASPNQPVLNLNEIQWNNNVNMAAAASGDVGAAHQMNQAQFGTVGALVYDLPNFYFGDVLGGGLEAGNSYYVPEISPVAKPLMPANITASYGDLRGTMPEGFQANHLNQNAVYSAVIPKSQGIALPTFGNALSDIGTPHYEFHLSLDEFFDPYRLNGLLYGQRPTNGQYGTALETALRAAGYSASSAKTLAQQAAQQRYNFGLSDSAPVPRIPNSVIPTPKGSKGK